jgi:hypothetical protein
MSQGKRIAMLLFCYLCLQKHILYIFARDGVNLFQKTHCPGKANPLLTEQQRKRKTPEKTGVLY